MKVAVLMSTYNGAKYLQEQIDSIMGQKGVDVELFIRDDGSTDETVSILKSLSHQKNIHVHLGENLGIGASFMSLLYHTPDGFDAYAFSDQDDIWLADKLERAVGQLDISAVSLYHSNLYVYENDEITGMRYTESMERSFLQLLYNMPFHGCTMVMTEALKKILCAAEHRPGKVFFQCRIHDEWIAVVAALVGTIVYDPEARILYRQHANNVMGASDRKWDDVARKIKKASDRKKRCGRSRTAKLLLRGFPEETAKYQNELEELAYYKDSTITKLYLAKDKELRPTKQENYLSYCVKILMGFV